ncbi:MAG: DoxX family protein [Pseudomonadota bacterium]
MLNQPDIAKLVLRLTLGILMLFHGVAKLTHGIGFIEGMVTSHGLPAFLAWGVYIGEIVAPLMLIAGVQVRIAALIVAANMVVAIVLVHMGDIFAMTDHGGWRLELQGMYLFTALALVLLGGGRYGVQKS